MDLELDHLFICVDVGGPEAERLIEFGLVEGTPNTHPGQGTANRRFFFDNAFLELAWVAQPDEAQSPLVGRTGLWQRWSGRTRGACPFGIGLRPAVGAKGAVPFPCWEYRPPYLPDPLVILMGDNSEVVAEPPVFYLSFGRRADSDVDPARRQPLDHAARLREITRVRISGPQLGTLSPTLHAVAAACPWLSFLEASEPLLEIGFDRESKNDQASFTPALPLVFRR